MDTDRIVPDRRLPTPSFVVPLGKSMYAMSCDSQNTNDAKVVENFNKLAEEFAVGSPEQTYLNSMLGYACAIFGGKKTKTKRRDSMLTDAERTCAELEDGNEAREWFWEKLKAACELALVSGFLWLFFSFVISVPNVKELMEGSDKGYPPIAITCAGLLLYATITRRIQQRRSLRISQYRRRTMNNIWKMYRTGLKYEYNHALNAMFVAWRHMTCEEPPDKEIAQLIVDSLLREADEYDKVNSDPDEITFIGDLLRFLNPWRTRKQKQKGLTSPA